MDIEKIEEVLKNVSSKPNKDIVESMELLEKEFEKSKEVIVKITKHMESLKYTYDKLDSEFLKRKGKWI